VTIAKEMALKDPAENLGAQMIRQAAERTGDAVGDGTSTATVLAHAIFADGVRNVVAGASAIDLKRGLDRGVVAAVGALRALSRPVMTRLEKAQVATISAHNDPTIGNLVADAMEKVGNEGVITVEESKTIETQLEVGGPAVRSGLRLAVLRHRRGEDGGGPRGRARAPHGPEARGHEGPPAAARAGGPDGRADPVHCRGHRGRGAGHARGEQAPRLAAMRGGQGTRVR
jgi:hypothetical protein